MLRAAFSVSHYNQSRTLGMFDHTVPDVSTGAIPGASPFWPPSFPARSRPWSLFCKSSSSDPCHVHQIVESTFAGHFLFRLGLGVTNGCSLR